MNQMYGKIFVSHTFLYAWTCACFSHCTRLLKLTRVCCQVSSHTIVEACMCVFFVDIPHGLICWTVCDANTPMAEFFGIRVDGSHCKISPMPPLHSSTLPPPLTKKAGIEAHNTRRARPCARATGWLRGTAWQEPYAINCWGKARVGFSWGGEMERDSKHLLEKEGRRRKEWRRKGRGLGMRERNRVCTNQHKGYLERLRVFQGEK